MEIQLKNKINSMKRAELIDWFLYWRAGKAEKRKVNEMNKSMNSFWRMNDLWMEWGKCRSAAIIAVNESKRKSMKREEIKQFVGWFVWLKLIDFWWTERSEQQPTIHNWNEEKAGFWFMKLWVMAGAQPSTAEDNPFKDLWIFSFLSSLLVKFN